MPRAKKVLQEIALDDDEPQQHQQQQQQPEEEVASTVSDPETMPQACAPVAKPKNRAGKRAETLPSIEGTVAEKALTTAPKKPKQKPSTAFANLRKADEQRLRLKWEKEQALKKMKEEQEEQRLRRIVESVVNSKKGGKKRAAPPSEFSDDEEVVDAGYITQEEDDEPELNMKRQREQRYSQLGSSAQAVKPQLVQPQAARAPLVQPPASRSQQFYSMIFG